MKSITIRTDTRVSTVFVGEHLQNLERYIPDKRCILITDDNLLRFYGDRFPPCPVISIGTGEKIKTLETIRYILEKLLEFEADRTTFVVGIGGGIVCDVAGFAASIYMRGLRFGFVSTTLLSQVDASVGGKNGVNFQGFKNMVGVFNQPEFVLCDTNMLATLDDREFRAGFSEIVKAAAIRDASLFEYLAENCSGALQKKPEVIEKLVFDSVAIKANVVETDEREKGERKKLNFGHTFAHSIEHMTGMLHGEAVSIGMVLAARLSVKLDLLPASEAERIRDLLLTFGLPVQSGIEMQHLLEPMKKDKKREGDHIHLVLLNGIGSALVRKLAINDLEKLTYDLR